MMTSPLLESFLRDRLVPDCPVIDTHAHYGPFAGIYFPRMTPAAMVATMDNCGVRWAFSSSHAALRDPLIGNEETAQLLAAYPTRFRGYWAISPYEPAIPDGFPANNAGFIGFKLHPGFSDYPLDRPGYQVAFEYAAAHKLPVLSHTWGHSNAGSKQIRNVMEKYPDLTFLLGHSCYGEWDEVIQIVRDYPHVYLELTEAYACFGVIERFVNEVGSNRILFGTDLPWFDPFYGVGCVLFSDITDEDRHNILHRNAEHCFPFLSAQ